MPAQTQHNSANTPLPDKTKHWRGIHQKGINLCLKTNHRAFCLENISRSNTDPRKEL